MNKIILSTIASFLETGIGIWIFAKAFPRRKWYTARQCSAGAILYILIAAIFCSQIIPKMFTVVKISICILPVIFFAIYYKDNKKRRNILFQERARVIVGILFCMVMGISAYNAHFGYISNITTLLGGLFPFIYLYIICECSIYQAYLWELLYLSHIGILKLAYLTYESQKRGLTWLNDSKLDTYGSIVFSIVISAFIVLLVRMFSIDKLLQRLLSKFKLFVLAVGIVLLSFTYMFMDAGQDDVARSFDVNELRIILVAVVCQVIGLLLAFSYAFTKIGKAERSILEIRNQAIEQQYQELHDAYEQNRCLVHDQKHMVQFLAECLDNGDIQAAEQFLKKYRSNTLQGSHHSWTGIATLDFIINMKKRKMNEMKIKFELTADIDEITINDADFVVLLGNLFDNAIEAAGKCEVGDRRVELTLRTINRMMLIQMKNANVEMPRKKEGRFLTTKKDSEKHGWGVASVEYIVKKYNGNINFVYDSQEFDVSICIPDVSGGQQG